MSTTQTFKVARRNSLYYGQYQYSAQFYLKEASALRELDHDKIEKTLAFRAAWTTNRVQDYEREAVHTACDCLLAINRPYKTMISYNWISFYTNDVADIDYLEATKSMRRIGDITTGEITHPKNTIGLKFPKHKFRTYVKSHKPTPEQCESLREFLKHNKADLKPSTGLKEFLSPKSQRYWMSDYFYVDHNDMRIVTALALINPALIRKTLPIVQVNN